MVFKSMSRSIDDVTAASNITDNAIVKGDGGAKGVQGSAVFIDDNNVLLQGTSTAYPTASYSGSSITPQHQIHGTTMATSSPGLFNWSTSANSSANVVLSKSKSGAIGTRGIVANGDDVGSITFTADDGVNFVPLAFMRAEVDGTPGVNDMPGRIVWGTTADGGSTVTERMILSSAGNLLIGSGSNTSKLTITDAESTVWGGDSNPSTTGITAKLTNTSGTVGSYTGLFFQNRTSSTATGGIVQVLAGLNDADLYYLIEAGDHIFCGGTSATEYVRITGSGIITQGFFTPIPNTSGNTALLQNHGSTANAGFLSATWTSSGASNAPIIEIGKARGAAIGVHGIVSSGDTLGTLQYVGSDGVGFVEASAIRTFVDGTPGVGDMPGRLVFYTTPNNTAVATEAFRLANAGNVYFPRMGTSGSAANVRVNTGSTPVNEILISTSSERYKTSIEDLWESEYNAILELRPRWYRSRNTADPEGYGYWGLIAEEVAEVNPRLASWIPEPIWATDDNGNIITNERGVAARIFDEETGSYKHTENFIPDSVEYPILTVGLVALIQKHEQRIIELEEKINQLVN